MTDAQWAMIAAAVAAGVVLDLLFIAWVIAKVGKRVINFLEHTLWR